MRTETDLRHCDDLTAALADFRASCGAVHRWGTDLARRLGDGGRLLAAGNGGSAAQAQHLTAELVGRYREDRPAYSAIALHADTSSTTAIANDYGVQEVFARQVTAHGRPGDVLMLLSTSGASANLLSAAGAARAAGVDVWALTGPDPNPLAAAADSALCVRAETSATVQELHLVAVHMLCEAFDRAVAEAAATAAEGTPADGIALDGDALGGLAGDGGPAGGAPGTGPAMKWLPAEGGSAGGGRTTRGPRAADGGKRTGRKDTGR
jgi:D-sedoheptulose 7-phosphate isomerase